MKNKCKIMILVFFLVFFVGTVNHNTIMSNAQTKYDNYEHANSDYQKEHIKMNIISVSKKKIKVQIQNTGDKVYGHGQKFILKIKKKGKWKKLKFEKPVKYCKCVPYINPNSSKTITIKWKDYYNEKLKKGNYKLVWPTLATEQFKVK